jgi:hypothetical protein
LQFSTTVVISPTVKGTIHMTSRRIRKSKSLAIKSVELAMAAPRVVAHRVTRLALAGPNPSARDRTELVKMVAEKQTAFAQAGSDMAMQAVRAHQALAASMWRALLTPSSYMNAAASFPVQVQNATIDVLNKGLAPIHRKAVANAKRLAKTRIR